MWTEMWFNPFFVKQQFNACPELKLINRFLSALILVLDVIQQNCLDKNEDQVHKNITNKKHIHTNAICFQLTIIIIIITKCWLKNLNHYYKCLVDVFVVVVVVQLWTILVLYHWSIFGHLTSSWFGVVASVFYLLLINVFSFFG